MFDPERLLDAITRGDTIPAGSKLVLDEESWERLALWLLKLAPTPDKSIAAEGIQLHGPDGPVFVEGREQEEGWTAAIAVDNPLNTK